MTETLHIHPITGGDVPIPVTFYISAEIFEDDGTSAEQIAGILQRELAYAIAYFREQAKVAP